MIYVLFMTVGATICFLGALLLLNGEFSGGALFVGVGALVLLAFKNKWKKWYDKKNAKLKLSEEKKLMASTPVSTKIIGSDSKAKTGSAIGRAVVGDVVCGVGGAVVGAMTAKNNTMTKFLVKYEDGHKAVETVKDNSSRFNLLISLLEED